MMNINEKLGVPDNLINVATKIWNEIRSINVDTIITIDINSTIGLYQLSSLDLNIKIVDQETTAYLSMNKLVRTNNRQFFNNSELYLMLNRHKDKIKIIAAITHELKHWHDIKAMGSIRGDNVDNYDKWVRLYNTEIPNTIMDDVYYLYMTTQIENLVKPSEIMSKITELDITKRGFNLMRREL